MTGYIVRRIGQAIIVVVGVTLLLFFLLQHVPGYPSNIAHTILGPKATQPQIRQFNQVNGLDLGFWHQYGQFLLHVVEGNLGRSWRQNQTVDSMISSELPRDIVLVGLSTLLALLIAIPAGIAQAVKRNSALDHVGTGAAFLLYSMPPYVPALIAIDLLADHWHLFPATAPQSANWLYLLTNPQYIALPVITLALVTYALFSRYMRSSAIDTLAQDYMRTARAKGLSERAILWGHLLRNSVAPVVTLVGVSIPQILTAGLITESIFNFNGVGFQYAKSATDLDFPVLIGITVLVALAAVLGNLLADVGYAVLDPRVRY